MKPHHHGPVPDAHASRRGALDSARLSSEDADGGGASVVKTGLGTPQRRLRVLVSAFACRPDAASEEAIGWNTVRVMARSHELWVVTRSANAPAIREAQAAGTAPPARFVFVPSTPLAAAGARGFDLDYYLWQARAGRVARRLTHDVRFDLAHHVTYGRYWAPSFLATLRTPYVLGPVGGGESVPAGLLRGLRPGPRAFEWTRSAARSFGERDPWVRSTIRRAAVTLAATPETAARLTRLGARDARVEPAIRLASDDLELLATTGRGTGQPAARFVCLSVGRILAWKGFEIGLRAFARAGLPDAEYWIVGEGPDLRRLEHVARTLGVADRVRFLGGLSRPETLERIASCDVLLHPSLHDSGGFVCLEAMAAGRPFLCLDAGGPAWQARSGGGVAVEAHSHEAVEAGLAAALREFGSRGPAYRRTASRGVAYARGRTWDHLAGVLDAVYREAAADPAR